MLNIETYIMSDGRKYNEGRILKDAGVVFVNAQVFAAYQRGEIEIAPEYKALMDEAQRRNAATDARDAAIPTRPAFVGRTVRSEWDARGSKDGE